MANLLKKLLDFLSGEKRESKLFVVPKTLYKSEDGHIVVCDRMENRRPVRLLLYDDIRESGIYLDENGNRDPLFYYMQTLKEVMLFYEGLDRALMIGGGGMAFPRYYTECNTEGQMTVVEKDRRIVDIAKKYFAFQGSERVNTIIGDGVKYISGHAIEIAADVKGAVSKKFDFIIFDAYEGRKPLRELFSEGVLKLTYQITSDSGILAINMLNEKPGVISMDTHLCRATLNGIYKNTKIINCPHGLNCILMASDRKL